ncbi:sugar kinase [Microbacterium halotolerans]|uniref:sugar kinase n=1 Tax=Microbacterium halotolerans TaxID=246613 RepID=UPI001F09A46B|nr:sugar kinase [Microbacterium halotolerans]
MSAAEPADVLCLGESMVLIASVGEGLRSAETAELHVAGAESNVAVGLTHLGRRAEWFSRVGADPFGSRILDSLRLRGVEVSGVVEDDARQTGVYFKDVVDGRSDVLYYRAHSAASAMSPADLVGLRLAERHVCHLSGITAALSESCNDVVDAVLSGRSGDVMTTFDVNFRPRLWAVERAAPVLLEHARRADIVFVGRDEAAELWGAGTADEVRELLPDVGSLVVKDADVGATSFVGTERVHVPAPTVDVVEPIGAGDAFAAGYLDGRLGGADERTCLRRGHVMAAHALRHRGDTPDPGPAQRLRELAAIGEEEWNALRFAAREETVRW